MGTGEAGARLKMTLLERDHALHSIDAAIDAARSGDGAALFVAGEPGLGKTTLLAEVRDRAAGFTLGFASCCEAERSVPFGLLDQLFGGLGAPGSRIGGDAGSSRDARVARFVVLEEWLREKAPAPLLLAVDDLHWADPDSTDLIAMLCRRLGGRPVAVIAALRPWPSIAYERACLLANDGSAVVEQLAPLSARASAALLDEELGTGAFPAEGLARTHDACAGNPLLLREVAEAWRRGEDVLSAPSESLATRIFLPRFAGVGSAALRWARGASVLGTRFHPLLVGDLVGFDGPQAAQAIEELCAAGLLRGAPSRANATEQSGGADGRAEFVHPLVRQALYDDIAEPVRQALHARAFQVLRAAGAGPSEMALHAVSAGLVGDQGAVDILTAAGREAIEVGGVATAANHFSAAVQLAGARALPDLRLQHAEACLIAGRVRQAEEELRRVVASRSLADRARVSALRLLGQVLLATARFDEAMWCAEEASDIARTSDPRLAAEILLDATFIGWLLAGPRKARATTRRVLEMVEQMPGAPDDLRLAALTADANVACIAGEPSGVDEMATAFRAAMASRRSPALTSPFAWDFVFGYINLAKILERFDETTEGFAALSVAAKSQGAILTYQAYLVNHCDTLWRLGKLDEAYASLTEAAGLSELTPTVAPFSAIGLAHVCHESGRDEESALWAARVETMLGSLGEWPYVRLWLLAVSCRSLASSGRVDEACAAGERAAALAEESGIVEPCVVPWHSAAIEAHLAAGRLAKAEALVSRLEEICAPLPCRAPRSVAAAGRAGLAWLRGDLEGAEALYEEALEHNAGAPMPLATAETLVAYGRFLRHTGKARRSRETLRRALEVLEPTGAGRLQRLAELELDAAGGRRRLGRAANELTPQERRAANLAAAGLTNREIAQQLFLSSKTVDHHLSHVYAKLGLRSRRELMLTWRGPSPSRGTDRDAHEMVLAKTGEPPDVGPAQRR